MIHSQHAIKNGERKFVTCHAVFSVIAFHMHVDVGVHCNRCFLLQGLVGDTTFAKGGFLFQQHIPLALVSLGGFNSPISLSLCASGGAVR